MTQNKLGLVVIFYNPTEDNIKTVRAMSNCNDLVIVDNSESPSDYNIEKAHVITLRENLGIASALNIGIKYLIDNGYEYALLLDQDSEPGYELISSLLEYISTSSEDVCLVAPAYYDRAIDKKADFIYCQSKKIVRIPAIGNEAIDASYVITSGSMLRISAIKKIGLMCDNLFIDFVDIEWCLRARALGYHILGLPWLCMSHEIGDVPVKVFNKKYVNHSPIRHYYYFRNVFLLLRMKHIHSQWKKMELLKLAPRFAVYSLFTKNRHKHFLSMLSGIVDGVLGRSGKKR
ncbi:glycosyltransferase family 2 protein [Leclercia adecarboxylata]|uniref:Glycosyltransferase family 2 protein n=1 Tax=Leclercia adecarboxylata TaxID=83655 RepID=A0A9X3YD10_9ENTR|nr:glycosyltransferase family 2 protein [Leclercia adecarboxylata]MBD1403461.1 glycosyltransferase family 2 protein [Leclercia adecarboxylata]MDC6621090.1 glycosyltransferase family 2 protein [Leclercia adecarboxylata]MDC6631665.1 glycosyltransferase family 2 protein [Leclercia adecarboxylata]MDC6640455.1 glycosyltransferase family 2 protein [Leclercia adecarboxylata]MDC6652794.1 glycosyltransferase family 2 protein [Leclercia adecarboxylata]